MQTGNMAIAGMKGNLISLGYDPIGNAFEKVHCH
jgi:hypothetical protein